MALARISVLDTSDGMSQAPGPIPTEKKARYDVNLVTANPALWALPTNPMDISSKLIAIPMSDVKKSGRSPFLSNKYPANTTTDNLTIPKHIKCTFVFVDFSHHSHQEYILKSIV